MILIMQAKIKLPLEIEVIAITVLVMQAFSTKNLNQLILF